MPVKVSGFIVNAAEKVNASSDLVKRVQLEIHGSMADLLTLMKEPLNITFEVIQPKFGDDLPKRTGGRKPKAPKGA